MSRTRLRGLEIGGVQIGIEWSETCPWDWPDGPLLDYTCLPREPEVHVGLRVAEISSADLGGECYGVGAWTFEVVPDGSGWLLGLSRRGRREQLASFDADFRAGEVRILPDVARARRFPLRSPIDEWIVVHRTVANGGLVVSGTALAAEGGASVRLGPAPARSDAAQRWVTPRGGMLGRDSVLLRPHGRSVRCFRMPWSEAMDPSLGTQAPVVEGFASEPALECFRERLDPDEAAELWLAHAVAPLCDESGMERVLKNVRALAGSLPMLRIGELELERPAIEWPVPNVPGAFAPPRNGF